MDDFRNAAACEWCGREREHWFQFDPHHFLIHRGHGGGSRLDIRANLISLCGLPCHQEAEAQKIRRGDLLPIVAKREGVSESALEAVVKLLWRMPKDSHAGDIDREVGDLDADGKWLLWKTLAVHWRTAA